MKLRIKVFEPTKSPICIIVDQSGIYIVSDNNFFECSPGKPIWKREQYLDKRLDEFPTPKTIYPSPKKTNGFLGEG
jgi:hypothetical protein